MFCPKCRKENDPSAVYCGGCGLSLRGTGGIPGSPKCYAKLVPLGGGSEYYLDRDKMLVGRRSEAEMLYPEIDLGALDDRSGISRRHAQILWDGSTALVEDLGSSNGTFINDQRMTEGAQASIKDGDTVRFGGYGFIYRRLGKAT
jgi:pSer/pThr/pTyr-binding forkhead associated (FHA) protein